MREAALAVLLSPSETEDDVKEAPEWRTIPTIHQPRPGFRSTTASTQFFCPSNSAFACSMTCAYASALLTFEAKLEASAWTCRASQHLTRLPEPTTVLAHHLRCQRSRLDLGPFEVRSEERRRPLGRHSDPKASSVADSVGFFVRVTASHAHVRSLFWLSASCVSCNPSHGRRQHGNFSFYAFLSLVSVSLGRSIGPARSSNQMPCSSAPRAAGRRSVAPWRALNWRQWTD